MLYRLKRIESTSELFDVKLTKLGEELLMRAYPKSVVPFDQRLYHWSSDIDGAASCPGTRVSYTNTSSLKDNLVRAKVPPKDPRRRRQAKQGFQKCRKRNDCRVSCLTP